MTGRLVPVIKCDHSIHQGSGLPPIGGGCDQYVSAMNSGEASVWALRETLRGLGWTGRPIPGADEHHEDDLCPLHSPNGERSMLRTPGEPVAETCDHSPNGVHDWAELEGVKACTWCGSIPVRPDVYAVSWTRRRLETGHGRAEWIRLIVEEIGRRP